MRRSIKVMAALALCVVVAFVAAAATKPKTSFTTMMWSIPSSLDPRDISYQDAYWVATQLYDTLYDCYHQNVNDIRPSLAEKYEVSKGNLVYLYYLRKGVTFTNGDEMTAEDVAYSLNAYRTAPATSIYCSALKGIEVVDRYSVRVTLKYPIPNMNGLFATPYAGIISKKAAEQFKGRDKAFVGTGPYKLKALKPGESVEMEANEAYFKGSPKIKTIIFRQISDTNAGTIAFLNGEVDLDITPPATDFLNSLKDKKIFTSKSLRTNLRLLAINNASGPLKDLRVRQAINYAIDPVAVNEMAHDGVQIPQYQAVPEGVEGYVKEYKPYGHDIVKAKALLAEAGYSDAHPLTLTLTYMSEGAVPKDATAVQAALLEAGIQVKGNALEQQAWLQAMYTRNYEIGYFEFYYAPLTAYLTYLTCFTSKGYFNVYNFSDPDVDKWAMAIQTELNPKTREELCVKINKRVMEKAAFAPLMGVYQLVMCNPKLKGLYFEPVYAGYKVYDMYWD